MRRQCTVWVLAALATAACASGQAFADKHGLVTVKGLKLTKAKHRIAFRPAK